MSENSKSMENKRNFGRPYRTSYQSPVIRLARDEHELMVANVNCGYTQNLTSKRAPRYQKYDNHQSQLAHFALIDFGFQNLNVTACTR